MNLFASCDAIHPLTVMLITVDSQSNNLLLNTVKKQRIDYGKLIRLVNGASIYLETVIDFIPLFAIA